MASWPAPSTRPRSWAPSSTSTAAPQGMSRWRPCIASTQKRRRGAKWKWWTAAAMVMATTARSPRRPSSSTRPRSSTTGSSCGAARAATCTTTTTSTASTWRRTGGASAPWPATRHRRGPITPRRWWAARCTSSADSSSLCEDRAIGSTTRRSTTTTSSSSIRTDRLWRGKKHAWAVLPSRAAPVTSPNTSLKRLGKRRRSWCLEGARRRPGRRSRSTTRGACAFARGCSGLSRSLPPTSPSPRRSPSLCPPFPRLPSCPSPDETTPAVALVPSWW